MTGNAETKEEKIRRFCTFRIFEHWIVTVIFGVLVITGLSQKFYSLDVSQWFIFKAGGIDAVRLLHRYTGIAFSALVFTHVMIGVIGVGTRKWRPSMIITKKDFTDAVHNIRYYLGIEDAPAACGRYTYKQKFEYWGVLLSSFIMILTGIILWFPALITRFMPGEMIPAAKVMHTNQGFLVFLIIALWHIYNAIFSPEIFPLDTSIITGYISRARMLQEHPAELARLDDQAREERIMIHQQREQQESL